MPLTERTLRICPASAFSGRAPRSGAAGGWRPLGTLLLALLMLWPLAASAQAPRLQAFEVTRVDDGLQVAFVVDFELPRGVEEALFKGVPLYFVASLELYRSRWYWRDRRISVAERTWRIAFQPLTRKFRVSFGGLNQSYDNLSDALVAVRRVAAWKVADLGAIEDGGGHYVEFSYRLDTGLLPRPLQIGLGGQADWELRIDRSFRID